jgi:uncharacterized protein (TIGR02246 family)
MSTERTDELFNRAFNSGDPKKVADLYTDDARAFPPGQELVQGHTAIEKMWEDVQKEYTDVELKALDVQEFDGHACECGTWTGKYRNKTVAGKYMTLWEKRAAWRIKWDIWNRNDREE